MEKTELIQMLISNEAILMMAGVLLLVIIGFIDMFINKDSSSVSVIIAGVSLIFVAGLGVNYIGLFGDLAIKALSKEIITQGMFDEFNNSSKAFLYLFPFVSAAIGTNLISDALTKNLTYKKKFSIIELFTDIVKGVFQLLAFIIMIPIVLVIVPIEIVWSFIKANKGAAVSIGNHAKRRVEIKSLKSMILFRDVISKFKKSKKDDKPN